MMKAPSHAVLRPLNVDQLLFLSSSGRNEYFRGAFPEDLRPSLGAGAGAGRMYSRLCDAASLFKKKKKGEEKMSDPQRRAARLLFLSAQGYTANDGDGFIRGTICMCK
jgi:hypothetical protein